MRDPEWADGVDTDGNGFVDDFVGWDFVDNDNTPIDEHGHGTHVAGTIGANGGNGIGISGVAHDVSMMSLRFLDENNAGMASAAAEAINYVTMMRERNVEVRITNNSWTLEAADSKGLFESIAASAGVDVLFVAAAGNGDSSGEGVNINFDESPVFPASYDLDNIISVAASTKPSGEDRFSELTLSSNFGSQAVDLIAPGASILSTKNGGIESGDGCCEDRTGTSMAAPHVTGVAALVIANRLANGQDATAQEVRQAILTTVREVPELEGQVETGGALDAEGALNANTFGPQATILTDVDDRRITESNDSMVVRVRYNDEDGVDLSSLDNNDISVTRKGFSAQQVEVILNEQSITVEDEGTQVVVDYEVMPPTNPFPVEASVDERTWSAIHNGTYTVSVGLGEVLDLREGQKIGTAGRRLNCEAGGSITPCSFAVEIVDESVHVVDVSGDAVESLRSAVNAASNEEGVTIILPDGTYFLRSELGDLDVQGDVTILGGGVGQTTIDASDADDRAIEVLSGELKLADLTITNGRADEGGGIKNHAGTRLELLRTTVRNNVAAVDGGGIWTAGDLVIRDSTLADNEAAGEFSSGGGIFNVGGLTIERSLLTGNTANGDSIGDGGGGGVFTRSESMVEISNTTFTGNSAERGDGGGILHAGGELELTHATIAENRADFGSGGGLKTCDFGCGATVGNSIVSTNTALRDINVAGGYEAVGTNLVDVSAAIVALGDLRNNGGPTQSLAPLANSVAVDAAFALDDIATTDQRGIDRPADAPLVADIFGPGDTSTGIDIRGPLVTYNGEVYFRANDGTTGYELWRTRIEDGRIERVADINAGPRSSSPANLTVAMGTLFFTADDGPHGRELWKLESDSLGRATLERVTDINDRAGDAFHDGSVADFADRQEIYLGEFTEYQSQLYFAADDGNGFELWKTDGTAEGTAMVHDINQRGGNAFFVERKNEKDERIDEVEGLTLELVEFRGQLYFTADDGVTGRELWKTNGETTERVADILPGAEESNPVYLAVLGDRLFLSAEGPHAGRELWATDGTMGGTKIVHDIRPDALESDDPDMDPGSGPRYLVEMNGHLYFSADDGKVGRELWRTDGTAEGTNRVKDIHPDGGAFRNNASLSVYGQFTVLDDTLFFTANDGSTGLELWETDGTEAATRRVADINRTLVNSSGWSTPRHLTVVGDELYFAANDGFFSGTELWRTDGERTTLVVERTFGSRGSFLINENNLAVVEEKLVFASSDGAFRSDVDISVYDPSTTNEVVVLRGGRELGSEPRLFTEYKGELYFAAGDQATGIELWKTDGSPTGTRLVKDINPGRADSSPTRFVEVNEFLLFRAIEPTHENELWRTDGTEEGTVLVKDIFEGKSPSVIDFLTVLTRADGRQEVIFNAQNEKQGQKELWKSDGTAQGTVRVVDSNLNPRNLLEFNGEVYFAGVSLEHGRELWKTDGTAAGTMLVKDMMPGTESGFTANTGHLAIFGDNLYFSAAGNEGAELWRTDGTPQGTQLVKDINPNGGSFPMHLTPYDGELFFSAEDGQAGRELWKTDGTANGTRRVLDLRPGRNRAIAPISEFVVFQGLLYFTANNGSIGFELWKTDGTVDGTELVADINEGRNSAFGSTEFIELNGKLYFLARDGGPGAPAGTLRLWETDGTTAGTRKAVDQIFSDKGVTRLAVYNDQLYFGADDGLTGIELRVLGPSQTVGAVQKVRGEVRGRVFHDANGNGSQDGRERALAGWTVYLDKNGNGLLDRGEASQLTDDAGYAFTEVEQGTYDVYAFGPQGFSETAPLVAINGVSGLKAVVGPTTDLGFSPNPAIVGGRVIYRERGSEESTSRIVELNREDPVVDRDTRATRVDEPISDLGEQFAFSGDVVAFSGTTVSAGPGVYLVDEFGTTVSIADRTAPEFTNANFSVESAVGGLVAFGAGTGDELTGLYRGASGAVREVAIAGDVAPGTTGAFSSFGGIDLSSNALAFHASYLEEVDGRQVEGHGIYAGRQTVIVDSSSLIPRGVGQFAELGLPSLSDGLVAFRGLGSEQVIGGRELQQDGIFLNNSAGSIFAVANQLTLIPGGAGTFTGFGTPVAECQVSLPASADCGRAVVHDKGTVVFIGNGADGQHGLYVFRGGRTSPVVDVRSGVFQGKTPRLFRIGPDALSGNQLVFHVTFADESEGIFLAEFPAVSRQTVNVGVAEVVENVNFGRQARNGSITGTVFDDRDGDRIRGGQETELAGWTVYLDLNRNGELNDDEPRQETGPDGRYLFEDLRSFTEYTVRAIPRDDLNCGDSDCYVQTMPTADSHDITLAANEHRRDVDFGFRLIGEVQGVGGSGTVAGTVFVDFNNNGKPDPGEPPVPNAQVYVDVNNNEIRDAGEEPVTTDEKGRYTIEGVPEGFSFSIRMVLGQSDRQVTPKGNEFTVDTIDFRDDLSAINVDESSEASTLVVANNSINKVTLIERATPNTAFAASTEVEIDVKSKPVDIAVVDLDGLRGNDFVVANYNQDQVSVLLDTGDAPSGDELLDLELPISTHRVGDGPISVGARDLNNDGNIDVFVLNGKSDTVSILPGLGAGQFAAQEVVPESEVGTQPVAIVAAELIGDPDYPELIVINGGARRAGMLHILESKPDAESAFGRRFELIGQQRSAGQRSVDVAAGDLNGDGRTDVVVVNKESGDAYVFIQDAEGGLRTEPQIYPVGFGPTSVVVADIDNDDDNDLVFSVLEQNGLPVSVLRNNGSGGFEEKELLGGVDDFEESPEPLSLVATDLNGDELVDFAVANRETNKVRVLFNELTEGAHRVNLAPGETRADMNFGLQGFQNPRNPNDVDDDGVVVPRDVLLVINVLNRIPTDLVDPGALVNSTNGKIIAARPANGKEIPYLDVNGDGFATTRDVLLIINEINGNRG